MTDSLQAISIKEMNRKAFTLIEVMVSIAIIGILMSLAIASYRAFSARSRDNSRKADLERVRTVLQQYYLDHRQYPNFDVSQGKVFSAKWQLSDAFANCAHTTDPNFSTRLSPTYLTEIPSDPLQKVLSSCNDLKYQQANRYYYLSGPSAASGPTSPASSFALMAHLEQSPNDLLADSDNPLKTSNPPFEWYAAPNNFDTSTSTSIGADANYVITGKNGQSK